LKYFDELITLVFEITNMNKLNSLLIVLAFGFAALLSCNKSKSYCGFVAPKMVYIGFAESESDTLLIKRYEKGTSFTKLVDTFLVTKANVQKTIIGKDSVVIAPANYTQMDYYFYANDWIVALPGAQHADSFTEILPRFTQESEPSAQCQSFVKSMKANSNIVIYEKWYGGDYKHYINK